MPSGVEHTITSSPRSTGIRGLIAASMPSGVEHNVYPFDYRSDGV